MGFLKNIKLDNGVSVEGAYHRINWIQGDQNEIHFDLASHVSRDFFKNNKSVDPLEIKRFSLDSDTSKESNNIFKQCYAYVKNTPDYGDVIDVFED